MRRNMVDLDPRVRSLLVELVTDIDLPPGGSTRTDLVGWSMAG